MCKVMILLFLISSVALADVVQISTDRGTDDRFINWKEQAVTWEETAYTEETLPADMPTDDDFEHCFLVEKAGRYWKFKFLMPDYLGELAVRWATSDSNNVLTSLWSEACVIKIIKPKAPIAVKS